MHEFSIMQEVANLAVASAQEAGAEQIHLIRLRVGKLSGVVPEAMMFVHEVAVHGTIAEGSKLEIEEGPIICYCDQCEAEFKMAVMGNKDTWVPGAGGKEMPVLKNGRRVQRVFNPKTGKHGWLDMGQDIVFSDDKLPQWLR